MVWTALRAKGVRDSSQLLLIAIPCAVLVSHYVYIHDLSVLLLPSLVMLNFFLPMERTGEHKRWLGRVAALVLVAPVVESYAPDHFYLVSLPIAALLVATVAAFSPSSEVQNERASA
jgi:hypothetical protein